MMAAIKAGKSDFMFLFFNIQRARWFMVSLTFNPILCFIRHSGIRYSGEVAGSWILVKPKYVCAWISSVGAFVGRNPI
jgi:hypothetical protein